MLYIVFALFTSLLSQKTSFKRMFSLTSMKESYGWHEETSETAGSKNKSQGNLCLYNSTVPLIFNQTIRQVTQPTDMSAAFGKAVGGDLSRVSPLREGQAGHWGGDVNGHISLVFSILQSSVPCTREYYCITSVTKTPDENENGTQSQRQCSLVCRISRNHEEQQQHTGRYLLFATIKLLHILKVEGKINHANLNDMKSTSLNKRDLSHSPQTFYLCLCY